MMSKQIFRLVLKTSTWLPNFTILTILKLIIESYRCRGTECEFYSQCSTVTDSLTTLLLFAARQSKPLQTEFQSNMDRLLGAQDRKRGAESEPSVQSSDKSFRGTQHEEFSEAEPLDAPSVIAPALAEEGMKRSSMIAALPSGGPDVDAESSSKVVSTKRAALAITNVSGDSYKGAGRVDRNVRRAEKRKGPQANSATKKTSPKSN